MSPQNSASSFMLLTPSQGLDSHKGTMNDQTKQNRAHSQSCITGISYLRIELLYFLYILVPDTSYMSIKNQYMICNAFNGCWTNKIILLYQTNQDLAQNTLSKTFTEWIHFKVTLNQEQSLNCWIPGYKQIRHKTEIKNLWLYLWSKSVECQSTHKPGHLSMP